MEKEIVADDAILRRSRRRDANKVNRWKKIVDECESSSNSIASFCRNKNLDYKMFLYWRKRLQIKAFLKTSEESKSSSFLPVAIKSHTIPINKNILTTHEEGKIMLPDPKWLASFVYAYMKEQNKDA